MIYRWKYRTPEDFDDLLMSSDGAYLTGLAGEMTARETGEVGMIAGDTVRHLPKAIRLLR